MTAIVEVSGLTKTYKGGFQALKGVDLAIEEGDMIEITVGRGANVRGWTRISEGDSNGAIILGPSTLRLVLASQGEHALVRPVLPAPAV